MYDPQGGQPLVSICIPAYNAAETILQTVQSALEQTYEAVEVIVVDDKSSDRTIEILQKNFPTQIQLIENEENAGLNRNWQKCIEIASGDYLILLGHDDQLMPECIIESLKIFQENPNLGFVYYNCVNLLEETIVGLPHHGRLASSTLTQELLGFIHVPAPSQVVLNLAAVKEVGGLDLGYRYCPEVTLYMKMLAQDWGAFYLNKVLCKRIRLEGTSLSARIKRSDILHDKIRFYRAYRNFWNPRLDFKYLRNCLAYIHKKLKGL